MQCSLQPILSIWHVHKLLTHIHQGEDVSKGFSEKTESK